MILLSLLILPLFYLSPNRRCLKTKGFKQRLFYALKTNLSIIRSRSPGRPNKPQTAEVTMFMPIEKPVPPKTELKRKRPTPPKTELSASHNTPLSGLAKILNITIAIKAASMYAAISNKVTLLRSFQARFFQKCNRDIHHLPYFHFARAKDNN